MSAGPIKCGQARTSLPRCGRGMICSAHLHLYGACPRCWGRGRTLFEGVSMCEHGFLQIILAPFVVDVSSGGPSHLQDLWKKREKPQPLHLEALVPEGGGGKSGGDSAPGGPGATEATPPEASASLALGFLDPHVQLSLKVPNLQHLDAADQHPSTILYGNRSSAMIP